MQTVMRVSPFFGLAFIVLFSVIDLASGGTDDWVHDLLGNALFYGVGISCTVAACGHLFFPEPVARDIGWEPSPFQWEVGMANAAVATLGYLSSAYDGDFWIAPVVAVAIWFGGDAIGHVRQMAKERNFSPGNAGFVFVWDIVLPAICVGLLIADRA